MKKKFKAGEKNQQRMSACEEIDKESTQFSVSPKRQEI